MTITTVSNQLQMWVGFISITQVWIVLSAALFLSFPWLLPWPGVWCYCSIHNSDMATFALRRFLGFAWGVYCTGQIWCMCHGICQIISGIHQQNSSALYSFAMWCGRWLHYHQLVQDLPGPEELKRRLSISQLLRFCFPFSCHHTHQTRQKELGRAHAWRPQIDECFNFVWSQASEHNAVVTPLRKAASYEPRIAILRIWGDTWLTRGKYGIYVAVRGSYGALTESMWCLPCLLRGGNEDTLVNAA